MANNFPRLDGGINYLQFQDYIVGGPLGYFDGVTTQTKFGSVEALSAGAETDVWSYGDTQAVYVFPNAAGETIEIVSDNVGDTGIDIEVSGLDANGASQTQTVTLNGTTAASISGTWTAVNRFRNIDDTAFAGRVEVRGDGVTSTNVFADATAIDQQTQQAVYAAPATKQVLLLEAVFSIGISGGANNTITFRLKSDAGTGSVFKTLENYTMVASGTSGIAVVRELGILLDYGAIVKTTAVSSTNNMSATARFTMLLVD